MMSTNNNVIDLTEVRLTRDSTADINELLQTSLHSAVANIAVMHGGKPDEWIDRKAAIALEIIKDMLDALKNPIQFSIPEPLSQESLATIETAGIAWMGEHNNQCRQAFAMRLVELLGP